MGICYPGNIIIYPINQLAKFDSVKSIIADVALYSLSSSINTF